jgi:LuxR family maltose regulon positive regulatory protein
VTETLLQTKLHIPMTRRSLVPRPHLLARLNAGLDGRLTLVSAPAGFGKTTLIVHWSKQLAESGAWRFAWFSLDENDNDLDRFFTYVVTALQEIDSHIGQSAMELLRSPQAANIQVVLTDLLNTLAQSTQPIVITLDNYHLITNPAIHERITFLLENAPPHFHLILVSRADPPFSLARLRARHEMTEIRQADLRFSQSETTEFLNQLMALDLPEAAVTALEVRTEGWVAGLQMAALSLQGRADVEGFLQGFSGSNRFILDYLAEEVLAQRPAGTREFLLQTVFLDRLCAPLCDAVLGIEESRDSPSQQMLEQLEAANLFLIPLDDERRWYRYHHLFAGLLQQQWRREKPALEYVPHARASRWFEQADHAEEAIQHALSAADYERATSLVTQYSDNWLNRGEVGEIVMWARRLPHTWRYQNPKLILNYAWALLFLGHEDEVEATIAHLPEASTESAVYLLVLRGTLAAGRSHSAEAIALLEKADAQLKTLEPTTPNQTMRAAAVNSLAYSYLFHGDDLPAEQTFEAAIDLNREVGNLLGVMNALRGLGGLLLEEARLHEAEAVCQDGLRTERLWAGRLGDPDRKLVAAAPLHLLLGRIYYQWNRLAEAEAQLVDKGKLVMINNPFDQCYGLMTLAKLRLAQGQAEAISPIIAQLQEMERSANPPYVHRQLAMALATTRCALFRPQPTPELRAAIERSLSKLAGPATDPLTQARALVTLDRPQEAAPLLEKLTAETEAAERHGLWLSLGGCFALPGLPRGGRKIPGTDVAAAGDTSGCGGRLRSPLP